MKTAGEKSNWQIVHGVAQFAGAAAIFYGLWQYAPPLAWCFVGLAILAASLYGQMRSQ